MCGSAFLVEVHPFEIDPAAVHEVAVAFFYVPAAMLGIVLAQLGQPVTDQVIRIDRHDMRGFVLLCRVVTAEHFPAFVCPTLDMNFIRGTRVKFAPDAASRSEE